MRIPKMRNIVGAAVIAAAFAYLAWTGLKASLQFAMTPAELLAAAAAPAEGQVKVVGVVKEGSLAADGMDQRFIIADEAAEVKVHHSGMLPNAFREGGEVVVTGEFDPGKSIFEATQVLAKCASKYQAR